MIFLDVLTDITMNFSLEDYKTDLSLHGICFNMQCSYKSENSVTRMPQNNSSYAIFSKKVNFQHHKTIAM